MRVTPAHGDHAIVEVAFQVELDRPWSPEDLGNLERLAPSVRDELPACRRLEMQPPPQGIVWPGPAGPSLEFAAYRRNGSFEWRVLCAAATVTVNCSAYTRWQRVSDAVLRYLRGVFQHTEQRAVRALTLQYIDEFLIDSDGPIDWSQLFDLGCDLLPPAFPSRGAVWHLHQGWFTDLAAEVARTSSESGRLLERLHLDSGQRALLGADRPEHFVRIDHYQRLELVHPLETGALLHEPDPLRNAFDELHERNKTRLAALLCEDVKKRIGLHAGS